MILRVNRTSRLTVEFASGHPRTISVCSDISYSGNNMHNCNIASRSKGFTGSILILPAVAFANIGELAVDVVISTLKCQLTARLEDDNILACVGNNAYVTEPAGLLATALELYQVPGADVYILQQRAPAIPGRQQAFAASLAEWAKQQGFKQIITLCGLDARYRKDHQLEGSQLRYLSSSSDEPAAASDQDAGAASSTPAQPQQQPAGFDSSCQSSGLLRLEQDVIATEREVHGLLPPWPLLDALQQQGLPYTLLSTFAAEGDNVQDGMVLASKLLAVLQQQRILPASSSAAAAPQSSSVGCQTKSLQLSVPCSWVGLYGRGISADSGLF